MINTSTLRQRLWQAIRKGDWKYASRTEDESVVNTTITVFGVATGIASTVLTAYYMDDLTVKKKERTPFIEAWYISACVGCLAGLANTVAMSSPWTAIAFYGTGVPVWAVRKWKNKSE